MHCDIYQSTINSEKYLVVAKGYDPTSILFMPDPDFAKVKVYQMNYKIDIKAILDDINNNEFSIRIAKVKVTTSP